MFLLGSAPLLSHIKSSFYDAANLLLCVSESFNCQLNQNGDIVLEIRLKWYRWKSIKALSWTDFIGASDGGTVSDPKGVEVSVGPNSICRKDDLPHPGVNDPSVAVYTLTQPESSSPALCGTVIVSTAPCHVNLFTCKCAKTKPQISCVVTAQLISAFFPLYVY